MPSRAAQKFESFSPRVLHLRNIANDSRIRPLPRLASETYYHACLALRVAAWETYIEELIREFYVITANPTALEFNAMHDISRKRSEVALSKFNTPNFENSRNILVEYTGYDPYSDWVWSKKSMSVIQVQALHNEILKVRHSFAHGHSIPRYTWNTVPSGRCRLTAKSIDLVEAFFKNLVRCTDTGMKTFLRLQFNINAPW
ncbi:HEPN domain-containing protein [Methylocystis sp. S23]